MIHKSSIDEQHAAHVSQAITEQSEPDSRASAKEILDFYMQNYEIVQVVRCDGCGSDLCLEVLDPDQYIRNLHHFHTEGLRRIELAGSPLLSSRKRLDGVMGYQCKCGNTTIAAGIELGLIPQVKGGVSNAGSIPVIEPHHAAAVAIEIAKQHYQPDVKINGTFKTVESFTVERLKGPAHA